LSFPRNTLNGAGLGALRRGAFLVVGRPNADSNFWSKTLVFDKARGQIFADSTPAPTPFMVTTIATAESIVPKIVIERSAALQKIFTDTIRYNVEQADKEASALKASVDTLVATERVFRYRDMDSVNRISRLLQDAVPTLPEDAAPNRSPNSPSANSLSAEDIYTLVSMMSRISGKSFSSSQQAIDWWTKKGKNGQFDRKKFLIVTDWGYNVAFFCYRSILGDPRWLLKFITNGQGSDIVRFAVPNRFHERDEVDYFWLYWSKT
jgi:hypothetical protein